MTTLILYGSALLFFILSYVKDKDRTLKALKNSWKSFENIMPRFLGIVLVVGLMLAVVKPEVISGIIGNKTGASGVLVSAVVGSITIMPTFVAFSTGDMLLKSGAGLSQVGALISTLTMVGVATFPMEAGFIGKGAAFYRNFLAFLFSFIVAFIIGRVLG